ncbi:hypothetical periplasmic protein [Neisseria animaloris]|nr:hypothetical protein BWD08_10325 [Neisseria animaloris]VEH86339.1 hypothetical periplasmic protein [Neisseria animaloris]
MNYLKTLTTSVLPTAILSACFSPFAEASTLEIPASDGIKQEQPALQAQQQPWLDQINRPAPVAETQIDAKKTAMLTNEDLMQHPALLHNLMIQALNSGNPHLLESLTAAYRKLPQADPTLLARAEGMLARYRGDYSQAVELYSNLHKQHPQDNRITLDTAAILQEDKQWKEADRLFTQAASVPGLPPEVLQNIDFYRDQNKAFNQWRFDGGISITRDNNINDAAPPYCLPLGCIKQQSESATGLNYQVSAEKNTPLKGHHNLVFRSNFSGSSYYFDKKSQYDNAFGRAYLGWQYQNARNSFNILPFYQWQLAGTNEWAKKTEKEQTFNMDMLASATGIQTAFSRQITPRLQGYLSAEIYQQNYREEERAERNDGKHYNFFSSLAYRLTPQHTLFGGLNSSIFQPKTKTIGNRPNNAGNTRNSISAGWLAGWPKLGGLNTQLRAAYTDRRYRHQALNTDFEWQQQHNKESYYSFSLAHPKIAIGKFMPKLTWEQRYIRSTHKWAERKHEKLFIEIEKKF